MSAPPPPPGPPPPPSVNFNPPPASKGRNDLLADIRKGNSTKLKKVPASQKKDSSAVDVKKVQGGSSSSSGSSGSSSSSYGSGPSQGGGFVSSGNPMMDEIMRKRANLGSGNKGSASPPKQPVSTGAPPLRPTANRAPPPSIPSRNDDPPKRAPPSIPSRNDPPPRSDAPQVPQRKAPPSVPTRRDPPPPIAEKRAPPSVPTRQEPPLPVKRAPPSVPTRQEPPSIPTRNAPPQQQHDSGVETDGRFQFRTDLPSPPPFKGVPKSYKSGKSQGTDLNIPTTVSSPQVERSAPPSIPTRKAPPPSVPSRATTADYARDAEAMIDKLKAKMDEHARNYEFEKCAPLRDLMRGIDDQKSADSTSPALKQLLDKAQTLL